MKSVRHQYDVSTDILTIEGVKYSGELFRQFAKEMPIGAPFRIMKRENRKTARKFRASDSEAVVNIAFLYDRTFHKSVKSSE